MNERCPSALKQLEEVKELLQFFVDDLSNVKTIKDIDKLKTFKKTFQEQKLILSISAGDLFEETRLLLKKDLKLNQLRPFREGRAAAQMKSFSTECWFFIDTQGNIITNTMFSNVSDFEEGKAEVDRAGVKWYIDRDGKKIGEFF